MLKLAKKFTNTWAGEKSCPKNVMSVTANVFCDNFQMIIRNYFKFILLTLQGDLFVISTNGF